MVSLCIAQLIFGSLLIIAINLMWRRKLYSVLYAKLPGNPTVFSIFFTFVTKLQKLIRWFRSVIRGGGLCHAPPFCLRLIKKKEQN